MHFGGGKQTHALKIAVDGVRRVVYARRRRMDLRGRIRKRIKIVTR
jgi:hypothetical protein